MHSVGKHLNPKCVPRPLIMNNSPGRMMEGSAIFAGFGAPASRVSNDASASPSASCITPVRHRTRSSSPTFSNHCTSAERRDARLDQNARGCICRAPTGVSGTPFGGSPPDAAVHSAFEPDQTFRAGAPPHSGAVGDGTEGVPYSLLARPLPNHSMVYAKVPSSSATARLPSFSSAPKRTYAATSGVGLPLATLKIEGDETSARCAEAASSIDCASPRRA